MAIIFAEDKGTGGLQKLQIEEDKLEDISKEDLKDFEESPSFTSTEMMMGNTKGTVPKGTVPKETVTSDKIEINAGAALADQFMNLTEDKQAQVLENIGLSKVEPTSDKDLYKDLSKEEQEQFRSKTNTKKTGLIKSAGKALSNIADKLN